MSFAASAFQQYFDDVFLDDRMIYTVDTDFRSRAYVITRGSSYYRATPCSILQGYPNLIVRDMALFNEPIMGNFRFFEILPWNLFLRRARASLEEAL